MQVDGTYSLVDDNYDFPLQVARVLWFGGGGGGKIWGVWWIGLTQKPHEIDEVLKIFVVMMFKFAWCLISNVLCLRIRVPHQRVKRILWISWKKHASHSFSKHLRWYFVQINKVGAYSVVTQLDPQSVELQVTQGIGEVFPIHPDFQVALAPGWLGNSWPDFFCSILSFLFCPTSHLWLFFWWHIYGPYTTAYGLWQNQGSQLVVVWLDATIVPQDTGWKEVLKEDSDETKISEARHELLSQSTQPT